MFSAIEAMLTADNLTKSVSTASSTFQTFFILYQKLPVTAFLHNYSSLFSPLSSCLSLFLPPSLPLPPSLSPPPSPPPPSPPSPPPSPPSPPPSPPSPPPSPPLPLSLPPPLSPPPSPPPLSPSLPSPSLSLPLSLPLPPSLPPLSFSPSPSPTLPSLSLRAILVSVLMLILLNKSSLIHSLERVWSIVWLLLTA